MKKMPLTHSKITIYLKYGFSILLTLLSIRTMGQWEYIASGLLELSVIFLVSDWLCKKWKIAGNIINSLLLFLFNAQFVVLLFGSSYLQMVMLTNLDSLEDLSGKALSYGIVVVPGVICSFLPVEGGIVFNGSKKRALIVPAVLTLDVLFLAGTNFSFSPFYGYGDLVAQEISVLQTRKALESNAEEISNISFYNDEITDCIEKPTDLNEKPNVILIFTEGLSQSLVEDERNIMPNVKAFEEKSIFFENYYNHTFATYRGLIGQLYSGYQLDNLDENYLISLNDIFQDEGYHTTFVNAEPENDEFTGYLKNFHFDEMVTGTTDGIADSVSDRTIYQVLFDTAENLNQEDEPFFISMYSFGTHASLYSTDEEFEDGSDDFLNKFYNLDFQFGEFIEAFENSDLAENTVIIFTADHATYSDNDFVNACPDYERNHSMLDRIPLCIYYSGIEADTIDVDGRNSLGLAPTVCDFFDINVPNYFIGTSLFSETEGELLETVFNDGVNFYDTENSKISVLTGEKEESARLLALAYFAEKLNQDVQVEDAMQMLASQLETRISDDGNIMTIVFTPENGEKYESILIPVISNLQGTTSWYSAELQKDGTWLLNVELESYENGDTLTIKIYANDSEFITQKNVMILD